MARPNPPLTVHAIARQIARGEQSSRAVVRHCLDTIAAEDGHLRAFVEVFAEAALARAEQLDRTAAATGLVGPLHGVPIAVKDLADLAGRSAGFGSRCFPAKPDAQTATAIQRLIDAGAVIIGVTHMVEFAFGGWGTNYALGTPWNPIDRTLHRVPGGSSSGSAVAVAAGMVPAAIGSDTGGSLRIPGSLCGCVGFKPSFGAIPLDGIAELAPTFDTLGPITHTVADARLLFAVMAGLAVPSEPVDRPFRLAVPALDQLGPCDPDILAKFQQSIDALRVQGHDIETITVPLALTEYQALSGAVSAFEAYRQHKAVVEDLASPLDPFVRQRVLAGRDVEPARYTELLEQRGIAISEFRARFGRFDAFLLPSTPLPAIPVSAVDEATIPMSRYTRIANWLNLSAVSVPNGVTATGLPTGLQVMGWHGTDARLLDLAHLAEAGFARS
ncbi:MAG: amidase [Alphaproteobacteria bacterium]|nr:amidase [Alphaproteobacteria bacterium]